MNNTLERLALARMAKVLDDANAEVLRLLGVKPVDFAYPCGQNFARRGVDAMRYAPLVAARFHSGFGYRNEAANDPLAFDSAQSTGVGFDGPTWRSY